MADYRDPWSHNYDGGKQQYLKLAYSWIEKRVVGSAIFITTAAEIVEAKLNNLKLKPPLYVLYNGFEQAIMNNPALPQKQKYIFSIAYAGTVYDWHPWQSFFHQMEIFKKNNPAFEFQLSFYGNNRPEEMKNWIHEYTPEISRQVFFYPKLGYAELIPKLAENHVFLLFNDYYIRGTKMYDYIGLKKHILFCYLNDQEALKLKQTHYRIADEPDLSNRAQADLIEKTRSGTLVRDAAHLNEVLTRLSDEFNRTGQIACSSENTEQCSREYQVKKLAELIRSYTR